MKLSFLVLCCSIAVACGEGTPGGGGGGGGGGGDGDGGPGGDDRTARAVVQVTEQHVTEPEFRNGSAFAFATPFSSESAVVCGQQTVFDQGGCVVTEFVQPPCGLMCGADETCTFDPEDDCNPRCVVTCTLPCGDGEYCRLADDGAMSCEPIEPYDAAGTIAITGLTRPTTLASPTYLAQTFTDAVYGGQTVVANAAGAAEVGFGPFELSLAPPADVVAIPPLSTLTQNDFAGDLLLSWTAGSDAMEVEMFASGNGGSTHALCTTSDSGQFTIPGALFAVFPTPTQAVRIDLKRIRETETDVETLGTYFGQPLPEQATAVLRLVRLETATIPFL